MVLENILQQSLIKVTQNRLFDVLQLQIGLFSFYTDTSLSSTTLRTTTQNRLFDKSLHLVFPDTSTTLRNPISVNNFN